MVLRAGLLLIPTGSEKTLPLNVYLRGCERYEHFSGGKFNNLIECDFFSVSTN